MDILLLDSFLAQLRRFQPGSGAQFRGGVVLTMQPPSRRSNHNLHFAGQLRDCGGVSFEEYRKNPARAGAVRSKRSEIRQFVKGGNAALADLSIVGRDRFTPPFQQPASIPIWLIAGEITLLSREVYRGAYAADNPLEEEYSASWPH
jgi:hypothetical protein